MARQFSVRPRNVLVVGCGSGLEAAILSDSFGAQVVGIDIADHFDPFASSKVTLRVADATQMPFRDGEFDFVYSYHALEHIPDYRKALGEMRRVLKREGGWCIGTPSRSRLLGYIGSKNASVKEKLLWNLADWKMRALGRFRNEYGAHAGFTATELSNELATVFGNAVDITVDYYEEIYPRHLEKLAWLRRMHLASFILPSVYFSGVNA